MKRMHFPKHTVGMVLSNSVRFIKAIDKGDAEIQYGVGTFTQII